MRLILIRHGQTPNNVRSLLDTAIPGPGLTAVGKQQAAAVPGALSGQVISRLYVSNLTRTTLTAAPLAADRALDAVVRPGIREISAGSLEMRGDPDSITAYLETVKAWLGGDLSVRMPGADTGAEVLERFDAVVAEAAAGDGRGAVAMISHGAMIRFWAGHRGTNIDWSDPKYHELSNTGIVTLDGEPGTGNAPGGWTVTDWQGAPAGGVGGTDFDGPTADLDADAPRTGHAQD
ncbi:histidine phosphatase family protein [Arthrobacter wenxiniae]|jgi:probable phosphoglycerate mutase|uniref:Histidine phosphatase family protein n=1 Tax=Arthrobacter wenxiniae TaxID=2713570 RepID=A0A7Y7ID99_9MICC|nr:histidine phosphatase family protein [Arthrobacter wenxiniae]NVM93379.1 histidine phosphatase family protein [Arthrobacter wenxiniae]